MSLRASWNISSISLRAEIFIGKDNVDVITRTMDEYTNNVADGLSEMIKRFWNGKSDD